MRLPCIELCAVIGGLQLRLVNGLKAAGAGEHIRLHRARLLGLVRLLGVYHRLQFAFFNGLKAAHVRLLRQCSSFVSLGIDIGFVSLRVGFLLLGLGCRGLHLVGVRCQHGSRRGQGKANGQHQSGRTLAQFVDFSHVPSSFNCCRVSGFACRP